MFWCVCGCVCVLLVSFVSDAIGIQIIDISILPTVFGGLVTIVLPDLRVGKLTYCDSQACPICSAQNNL